MAAWTHSVRFGGMRHGQCRCNINEKRLRRAVTARGSAKSEPKGIVYIIKGVIGVEQFVHCRRKVDDVLGKSITGTCN